ncbi:transient receptor potential cation channel subfamily A member 1a [Alosa alosa]|uniref:transient receptor potential cation channel subfamily A member 1a n=1 Tax=Alosa alosa TaxID=278164 RepID=UPI0020154DE0|nr:transient receptor potential cation channel subfamily A member 1a [Alosa alosa]
MSIFMVNSKHVPKSSVEVVDDEDTARTRANVFEWAQQGNLVALEKHMAYLTIQDHTGACLLHHAMSSGHLQTILLIAQAAGTKGLNAVDQVGNTPLHWAVEKEQRESCSALLALGANPNVLNKSSLSPLHLAVSLHHNTLVEEFLSYSQTDANIEGELGNTPVMIACATDNHEALHILFKHGAQFCSQNKLGHFPIHAAAFAGAKQSMQVILQRGVEMGHSIEAHINYVDKSCNSPIHLALRGGNLEIIKLCMAYGAKINRQQQCDKSTALHSACTQGATEAVKVMLSACQNISDIINITDGCSQTPLHKAAIFDHNELAEYLISKGADIDLTDYKGHSPLLLATSCGAWRTVNLLLSHGCNFTVKDMSGCNFMHLTIMQPGGLRNLPTEFLQHECVRELLGDEDDEGCTPLHYACKLGVVNSVRSMLGLEVSPNHKSKQKKSALHFAAEFGRINTCYRILETMTDTRLLNEGDEKCMTPLHLACRNGHVRVVELLLCRGALCQSDYKGCSCLHHAAAGGYTQTMDSLLGSHIKLLDKTDDDGNTALHLAAREGHTAAVRLLLKRGAQILLNKSDASFLHEAIHNYRKEAVEVVLQSNRCAEVLGAFNRHSTKRCAVLDMIELLPETFKHLLDLCIKESEEDPNSMNYWIEYNFKWLQSPIQDVKQARMDKGLDYKPLPALNAMVHHNRVDLLTHPVCRKYLEMKWKAYGVKVHLLNMAVYMLGLLPLTYLILNLRPILKMADNNTTTNEVTMTTTSLDKQCNIINFCLFPTLAMNLYSMGKEIVQIYQQRTGYLRDVTNALDWLSAITSVVFVVTLLQDMRTAWHWQIGALAVFYNWMNLLLYLRRFERFGIYVVMFQEIAKTLVCTSSMFMCLILAVALAFHALMLKQKNFGSVLLSIMQTSVMMVGELNYHDNILKPYLKGNLPFPTLTFIIFIGFVLLAPILLVNLLIGLAVGDIAEVQKNAILKQIAMQIELHTGLEEKLPYWFMKRADRATVRVYPNRHCSYCSLQTQSLIHSIIGDESQEGKTRLDLTSSQSTPLAWELAKQKYRIREISSLTEKQNNLLKLIMQKLEINSESEDTDGPDSFHSNIHNLHSRTDKWTPVIRAVMAKRT